MERQDNFENRPPPAAPDGYPPIGPSDAPCFEHRAVPREWKGRGWERRQGSPGAPEGEVRERSHLLAGLRPLEFLWRGADLSKRVHLVVDPRGAPPPGCHAHRLLENIPVSHDASCCQ